MAWAGTLKWIEVKSTAMRNGWPALSSEHKWAWRVCCIRSTSRRLVHRGCPKLWQKERLSCLSLEFCNRVCFCDTKSPFSKIAANITNGYPALDRAEIYFLKFVSCHSVLSLMGPEPLGVRVCSTRSIDPELQPKIARR